MVRRKEKKPRRSNQENQKLVSNRATARSQGDKAKRTFSQPTGLPEQRVETTNLPPIKKEKVSEQSGAIGLGLAELTQEQRDAQELLNDKGQTAVPPLMVPTDPEKNGIPLSILKGPLGVNSAASLIGNQLTEQGFDVGEANAAGLTQAGLGGAGASLAGAGIGAIAGAGVGAVPGAIIGGVLGLVTGYINGVRGELKEQSTEKLSIQSSALSEGTRRIRALATDTNKNPQNAAENVDAFYKQLEAIDVSNDNTKYQSFLNINKWIDVDTQEDLAAYERFNAPGGQREFWVRAMNQAVAAPNPTINYVTSEDLGI